MPDTAHDRLASLRIDRSGEDETSSSRRPLLIGTIVLVLVLFVGWWLLARDRGVPVAVASPTPVAAGDGGARSVLDASGYVVARREATVSSKVTGRVAEVLVEEGMEVGEGQLLARLDDVNARRELELARARAAAARSALAEIEVQLRQAELDLRRTRALLEKGAESQAKLDAALAARDGLTARLEVARAEVTVAERQVALGRQALEDTRIRAPFAGVAVSKDAQPGEMISPVSAGGGFTRTGITTIVDMSSLEIEVDVNEAYIQRVSQNQRAVALLDAYPEWRIPAHVITIVPTADRQKATVKVRIGFDELGDPRILPDMGVKVSFRSEEESAGGEAAGRASAVLIPRSAVRREGERAVVFVVTGDRAERRAISLGPSGADDGIVEVVAGVRPTDRVVLDPPETLRDGDAVRVIGGGKDG